MKSKILAMKTIGYPGGRIDSFKIGERSGTFESLVSCLVELGFSESEALEVDSALEHREYAFLYLNQNLKVHLSTNLPGDFFFMRFDTKISRKNIIGVMFKYFQMLDFHIEK